MFWPISTHAVPLSDRDYRGRAWRVVEAQHKVSTLKLVDNGREQALLEDILEDSKPPLPQDCAGLHYLLATPFRYRPYPHGSRFRRAGLTEGVFYAAEGIETALSEMAFYRLLFFAESPATPLPANAADLTGFGVMVATRHLVDLTSAPLSKDVALWTDPVDYAACQALADRARAEGAGIIRYRSVRDPDGKANLAVLTCASFAESKPSRFESWKLYIGRDSVTALRDFPARRLEFSRVGFTADPRLAGTIR